jgi:acyl carrier protein
MGLTHLVTFLEDDFGIKLEYSDVEPGNFRTIGDIARLVTERS